MAFSQEVLAPLVEATPSLLPRLEAAMMLLAFDASAPECELLSLDQRSRVASELNGAILASQMQAPRPPLAHDGSASAPASTPATPRHPPTPRPPARPFPSPSSPPPPSLAPPPLPPRARLTIALDIPLTIVDARSPAHSCPLRLWRAQEKESKLPMMLRSLQWAQDELFLRKRVSFPRIDNLLEATPRLSESVELG